MPTSLAFGKAKTGVASSRTVTVHADSTAAVEVHSARLEDLAEPGGAGAFAVVGVPLTAPKLGLEAFEVTFTPSAVRSYDARLLLDTNDPANPTVELILVGEGAAPSLELTPVCEQVRLCRGSVVVSPPAIDFGLEVFARQQALPIAELPFVVLRNTGEVELLVSALDIEGPDAAAFSVDPNVLVDSGPGDVPALLLAPGEAAEVPLRFSPTSEAQTHYAAQLVVRSDALATPEVHVALRGSLRPNSLPDVCANITRVMRGAETLGTYDTEANWAPLRTVPPGTPYDFTATRNVVPAFVDPSNLTVTHTKVTLSALSPGGDGFCTRDPEEGRQGLTFAWTVLSAPPGATAPRILAPTAAQTEVELGPQVGIYEIALDVLDPQGGPTVRRTLRFAAVPREDLVVQLTWDSADNAFRNVDLDLHLVRPFTAARTDLGPGPFVGAFAWFDEPHPESGVLTSGDLNGRALLEALASPTTRGFDWGERGPEVDDPLLPFDDTGAALQLETITLTSPENDPLCETEACTYPVYVHYYRDGRAPPNVSCSVTGAPGCHDGEQCSCESGFTCVATTAPASGAALGPGKCLRAPRPVVRVFAKAAPAPLATFPVGTQSVQLGAPCQMLHVANVRWPARLLPDGGTPADGETGEPQVEIVGLQTDGGVAPVVRRFGRRESGGLTCLSNDPAGPPDWYEDANDPP
ncbi:MAG: choice-of-anchor D domain-containing protein [Myxococcaceae bacterium]|nr:choice-of-anchor D domain-containing protein [Myxococcaceae bacterium]MCI0670458.1 choice-of-anchor D domain-containing protein [Myxococcaceae bacterium]